MGIFDRFRKKKKENTPSFNSDSTMIIPESFEDTIKQENIESTSSNNELDSIINRVKETYHIEYITDLLKERMNKYPKLVDLLLEGNVSDEMISELNYTETMTYLPYDMDDLKYIEFFDLDEKTQKKATLLKNRIDNIDENEYEGCGIDLQSNPEIINMQDTIKSFIPGIELVLKSETLTKATWFSNIKIYYPRSKNKITNRGFDTYIKGELDLGEDTIIDMDYNTFLYLLDEQTIDKISNCKINITASPKDIEYDRTSDVFNSFSDDFNWDNPFVSKQSEDYKLIKYNHLLYIFKNSSLDKDIKDKLLYKIEEEYFNEDSYYDLNIINLITPYLDRISSEEIQRLSTEFQSNIEEYKAKTIEKPEFNATYYIDSAFTKKEKVELTDVIYMIKTAKEEYKQKILQEPRIRQVLDIPDNLDEENLKSLSYLLSQRLTPTTMEFAKKFNFNMKAFMEDPSNNYNRSRDINPIANYYGVFTKTEQEENISVADIVGHDGIVNCGYYKGSNILYTFENFFEKKGDDYHSRALALLDYDSGEDLLNVFKNNNNPHNTKDMVVRELDDGKYVITSNGLHKYTVLRFHYLLDRMKHEKSEEDLRNIYTIPVQVRDRVDLKKTYCNYLMNLSSPDILSINFNNKENKFTIVNKDDKESVHDMEELIPLTIKCSEMLDSEALDEINKYSKSIDSFNSFLSTYLPNLLDKNDIKSEEGVK